MSLPQHIIYGVGGEIYLDSKSLPSNALVTIRDSHGTAKATNAVATISTINTVINAAVNAGDMTLQVVSATGISVGKKIWIQDDPEEVLVKKVSGTEITLRRPVVYDHVNAATVEGSRITYDVNSTVAGSMWWDGRAEWIIDGQTSDFTALECTKYSLRRLATVQDLYDVDPSFHHLAADGEDIERGLDAAFMHVLKMIAKVAPNMRVRVYTASQEFSRATAIAYFMLKYRNQPAQEIQDLYRTFRDDLEAEVSSICQILPRDTDQDGVIEADEQVSYGTVRLIK